MRTPGKTAFWEAVKNHRAVEVVSILGQCTDFVALKDDLERTPLHLCARRRVSTAEESRAAVATARALVKAGVDVNAVQTIRDDDEVFPATALWYALAWGRNRTLASYLLKQKADPNHCMFATAFADDLSAARLLRRYKAHIDEVSHGETPLIYAIRHRRVGFAEWLLREGADPNYKDGHGFTALHHAVRKRLPDSTIRALLRHGAEVHAVSSDGTSVAQLATRVQRRMIGLDAHSA
jgi:ankyrin repeat protein